MSRVPRITGPHFAIVYFPWGIRFIGVDARVATDFLKDNVPADTPASELPTFDEGSTVTVEISWANRPGNKER